jgi:hypothetical protein
MLIPSAILFRDQNTGDFFTSFHGVNDLKQALERESPELDNWISKNKYSCCGNVGEYIYACRVSLKSLNEWTACVTVIDNQETLFMIATPSYFSEAELPTNCECQFDKDSSVLPIVMNVANLHFRQIKPVKPRAAVKYWNPSVLSPTLTNNLFKSRAVLGQLSNIEGMAYCELQAEITRRLKLSGIISNLVDMHDDYGGEHLEPRVTAVPNLLTSFQGVDQETLLIGKIEAAHNLASDICQAQGEEVLDIHELASNITNDPVRNLKLAFGC